ncbi:hypothetical protein LFL96_25880 [Paraburkholderia sp. D15]|uniref:hypothetical protein n=1 Tax=Paraburkholderia sp. D15 TaxID=2880218 RepID=UPI00247AACA0|nr:hypothetical protein [Paraburkholderia sp. D15]WGS54446.1 hypothetical protein LFL96_25880 [Paraburkholderia sp. D15]
MTTATHNYTTFDHELLIATDEDTGFFFVPLLTTRIFLKIRAICEIKNIPNAVIQGYNSTIDLGSNEHFKFEQTEKK